MLGALGVALLAEGSMGCAATPPATVQPPPLPPLHTEKLAELVTAAGLSWIVTIKPRTIAQIPWLIPEIARFASEARLDAFGQEVGLDLRQVPEAIIARFDETLGGADLQLVRAAPGAKDAVAAPDAVPVLAPGRPEGEDLLFFRERYTEKETWDGTRAGPGNAITQFGADAAYPIDAVEELAPQLPALRVHQ